MSMPKGYKHSPETRAKIGLANRGRVHNQMSLERIGSGNPMWKGGRTKEPGRIRIRVDQRYVAEHRLIMVKKLGRPLLPSEVVHHIDLDGHNNDPDNLALMSPGYHAKYHQHIKILFEHWLGG